MFDCLQRGGALKVDPASLRASESDDSRAGRRQWVTGGGWREGKVGSRRRDRAEQWTRAKDEKVNTCYFHRCYLLDGVSNPSQTITLQYTNAPN